MEWQSEGDSASNSDVEYQPTRKKKPKKFFCVFNSSTKTYYLKSEFVYSFLTNFIPKNTRENIHFWKKH